MKQSYLVKFILLLLLLCGCIETTRITPANTIAISTPQLAINASPATLGRDHLIQQVAEGLPEWPTYDRWRSYLDCPEAQGYLVDDLLNLLSHPDAQGVNFEDLQEIFQAAIFKYR